MHPASPSIKYFGLYVALTGVGLLMAPGLVLAPIGVAAPTEVWIRVVGAISIVLGYYYWSCGTAGAIAFYRATVRGRIMFAALTLLLVVLFEAPVQLLLFGVIDLVGAAWTAQGLRKAARHDAPEGVA
jgi:hypothetical protein